MSSEFLLHLNWHLFHIRTWNLIFLFLLTCNHFLCANNSVLTPWKYIKIVILMNEWLFIIFLPEFRLFKARLINFIFLFNTIILSFKESLITRFTFAFLLLVCKIGLKMFGVTWFDFLIKGLEQVFLFPFDFFVILDEFDNHTLFFIGFGVGEIGEIGSCDEPGFVFVFVSFYLVECGVVTGRLCGYLEWEDFVENRIFAWLIGCF